MVQHIGGDLPVGAQRGLTTELKSDAYICACLCKPTPDLKLKSILAQNLFMTAHIHEKQYLSESVVKILVEPIEEFIHSAGQYINLRRFDGLTRSYSITNDPDSKRIELHIRRKYNGQFSDWLFNHASSFVSKGQQLIFLSGTPLDQVHVLTYDYKDLRLSPRDD